MAQAVPKSVTNGDPMTVTPGLLEAPRLGSLAGFDGGTVTEKVASAVASAPVVVVIKTSCPFCTEVLRTLGDWNVPYVTLAIDTMSDGPELWKSLRATTLQTTVPYVYVGGKLVGGCDATKAAQHDGSLVVLLAASGIKVRRSTTNGGALRVGELSAPLNPFSFPEAVDDRAVRLTSFWILVTCLLSCIYYKSKQAHWVMGGLMVDFALRFMGGANISPLGSLSNVATAVMELFGSKPVWRAGVPKQFATFAGLMFSALAFFFFLVSVHEGKLENVGLAFTAALGMFAMLESFMGFCMACWMFELGIQFKLLPANLYQVFTNALPEVKYTWEDGMKRLKEGPARRVTFGILPQGPNTLIDYRAKAKTDDMSKEDFHVLKHVKITQFLMPLGLTGLANAWRAAAPFESLYAPTPVEYAIALLAVTIFVSLLALYSLKVFFYPNKVMKEWNDPLKGNAFNVPFIITILFADLVVEQSRTLAHVLFWIGAPAGLFLSLTRVGMWISRRMDIEHVNAAWMIMPVGNAVAALVGPEISPLYRNACQFWFAVALVMWLLIFAVTFWKAILKKEEDDRARPLLAIWVAAPAVLGLAYATCYPPVVGVPYNDFIYINLHWISVATAFMLSWAAYRPFFGRLKFDMSYWATSFPADALAFTCIFYHTMKPGNLSKGIALAALFFASVINAVLLLQTLAGVLRRRIFTPDIKWGPLSFMKLTHEACRSSVNSLVAAAELVAGGAVDEDSVDHLAHQWRLMRMCCEQHSAHEEKVIFKLYNDMFPGLTASQSQDHKHHQQFIERISELVNKLTTADGTSPSLLGQEVLSALQSFREDLLQHFKSEEEELQGMPRKHVNLKMQNQIVRQCWELTPAHTWFDLLPYIVNNLPMLVQRVRFLKTLLWGMPERAQQIGMILGVSCDAVQWARITAELPEIIPRGCPGWERYN